MLASLPRCVVAPTLFVSLFAACNSWSAQSVSPREFFSGRAPREVRITRADSSKLVVQNPRLHGDSVIGDTLDSAAKGQTVPLSEIQAIEIRRNDPTKTTLFVVGLGVTAGILAAALDDPPAADILAASQR
jgi:hypothetical protein